MRGRVAIVVTLAVIVLANVLTTRVARELAVPVAIVGTVALLVVARASRLSWDDLGLSRSTMRRGLVWAGVAVAAVTSAYALVLLVPGGRELLEDDRTPSSWGEALVKVLVLIPLRTVLLEEVAFRGVLWALLRREWSTRAATIWSSVAFGLWHVSPALGFADSNDTAGDVLGQGSGADLLVVIGTVIVTGLAGVLLCEARRRSGSLLAPIGIHWAANGVGTLAAVAAD